MGQVTVGDGGRLRPHRLLGEPRDGPPSRLADHQGQATARVRLWHDTLYVAATCDSLRRLVLEYEGQLRHAATRRESTQEKGDRRMGWPTWAVALAFIGGIVIRRTRLK